MIQHSNRLPQEGKSIDAPCGGSSELGLLRPNSLLVAMMYIDFHGGEKWG